MKKYDQNVSAASMATFDKIQQELECCGVEGPRDWANSVFNAEAKTKINSVPKLEYKIPTSCCRVQESKTCAISTQLGISDEPDSVILWTEGCATKMKSYLETNQFIILALLSSFVVSEFVGILLSLILCCSISRNKNVKL